MRVSSPALAAAFIEGAREQGASVVDYGMLPTDVLYFAVVNDDLDGGAQITASHNPKQYNGIKMVRSEALPLSGDAGLGDIRDMIANDRLPAPSASRGGLTSRDVLPGYVDKVMSFIDPSIVKPFNVVLDAGSGMAGKVAPLFFDRLPCRTTRLCFEVDGTFPNHEANPLIEENRRDITAEVVRQSADVGIAWDGDADRCFFIDGSGEFISGDFVTALLAEAFLLKQPGATIIYDLRASHAVRDTVAQYGGRALMNRVGHAFIKQRMRKEDGVFAGEVTGHYYFKDFYYADNGFIPALLILELMSKKNQSLRDLLRPYRERYFISGRDQHQAEKHGGGAEETGGHRDALPGCDPRPARRRVGGLPRLALQRARLEYRATPASQPRGADSRTDGTKARRGAGCHSRVEKCGIQNAEGRRRCVLNYNECC